MRKSLSADEALGGQQALVLARGAADEGRETALVGRLERLRHLVETRAVGAQGGQQRLAVLEEDVGPDAGVAAGDARHVAKARTGGQQRVARAVALAGLCHEHVGQHVRQVADQGQQAVVLVRLDRDRTGADLHEKVVELLEGDRPHVGARRKEVGGALVQRGPRVAHARRLGAAQRMTAHAAALLVGAERVHEHRLGAADVAHDRPGRGGRVGAAHVVEHQADRRADEDEVGGGGGLFEAVGRLGDGAALEGGGDRRGAAAVAHDAPHAGELASGEPERAAHEPDPDDRDRAFCPERRGHGR